MTPSAPLRIVIGSGYLGSRVASRWVARGDRVVGTTRSAARAAALVDAGVDPRMLEVTAADWLAVFAETGPPATLFWSVGFDRSSGAKYHDVHVAGLQRLLDALAVLAVRQKSPPWTFSTDSAEQKAEVFDALQSPHPAVADSPHRRQGDQPPRVIFCSSTGVWGDEAGEIVDENTPVHPSREAGRTLAEAEAMLAAHPAGPGTSLRFAGLYGPGRLPRLDDLRAGRPLAADPESWLNLIHVDDAAQVVEAVADARSPSPLYVVADGHPVRRRDWYTRLAELSGSPMPRWDPTVPATRGGDKRINPARLLAELPVTLAHHDALEALRELLSG